MAHADRCPRFTTRPASGTTATGHQAHTAPLSSARKAARHARSTARTGAPPRARVRHNGGRLPRASRSTPTPGTTQGAGPSHAPGEYRASRPAPIPWRHRHRTPSSGGNVVPGSRRPRAPTEHGAPTHAVAGGEFPRRAPRTWPGGHGCPAPRADSRRHRYRARKPAARRSFPTPERRARTEHGAAERRGPATAAGDRLRLTAETDSWRQHHRTPRAQGAPVPSPEGRQRPRSTARKKAPPRGQAQPWLRANTRASQTRGPVLGARARPLAG